MVISGRDWLLIRNRLRELGSLGRKGLACLTHLDSFALTSLYDFYKQLETPFWTPTPNANPETELGLPRLRLRTPSPTFELLVVTLRSGEHYRDDSAYLLERCLYIIVIRRKLTRLKQIYRDRMLRSPALSFDLMSDDVEILGI